MYSTIHYNYEPKCTVQYIVIYTVMYCAIYCNYIL